MDGHWACGAAGHVEAGESVLDAAVREAREEIGVVVDPRALEPLTAMHRSNDVGGAALEQRVDFFFALRRWEGEPVVREPARTGVWRGARSRDCPSRCRRTSGRCWSCCGSRRPGAGRCPRSRPSASRRARTSTSTAAPASTEPSQTRDLIDSRRGRARERRILPRSAGTGPGARLGGLSPAFPGGRGGKWRSGRIVRTTTPDALGGSRMIPRFLRRRCRVGAGTILPERHFPPPSSPRRTGCEPAETHGTLGTGSDGACPNLPQRPSAAGAAAEESAEYQRFSSRAPARSEPLQQIWTTAGRTGPGMAGG